MKSNSSNIYDVLIIGGGIAGTAIARDAAMRGLSVILLEKKSCGWATSSRSSRLIHGGIRYLELAWNALLNGNFKEFWRNFLFVFYSLRETVILRRIASEEVKPLTLLAPVYRKEGRGKLEIFAGAALYAILALCCGSIRPVRFLWSKKAVLQVLPSLNPDGLTGGVFFQDHWTDDLKLVQKIASSAQKNGAEIVEQHEVTGFAFDARHQAFAVSVKTPDEQKTVYCRQLVNASGPWLDRTLSLSKAGSPSMLTSIAGAHIMLPAFTEQSMVLQAHDKRILFVLSVEGKVRVGTTERPDDNPDQINATNEEIDYLLQSLRHYFPGYPFHRNEILSSDAGIRPLAKPSRTLSANAISREHVIYENPAGVFHIAGVKLTDHRRAAEDLVNRLVPLLKEKTNKTFKQCETHKIYL